MGPVFPTPRPHPVSLTSSPGGGGSFVPPSFHDRRPRAPLPPLLPPREQLGPAPGDAKSSPHRALLAWRAARRRRSWRGRASRSCSSTCPQHTVLGVDTQVFSVGPRFRGIKMVPSGPHFINYCSASRHGNEFAPTVGFIFLLTCLRWSFEDGIFKRSLDHTLWILLETGNNFQVTCHGVSLNSLGSPNRYGETIDGQLREDKFAKKAPSQPERRGCYYTTIPSVKHKNISADELILLNLDRFIRVIYYQFSHGFQRTHDSRSSEDKGKSLFLDEAWFSRDIFFSGPPSFIPPLLNSMSSSEVPGPNDPILLERLLLDLLDLKLKGHALFELRKKRNMFPDLAPLLWYSFGTIAALLQEIPRIYPALLPPTLTLAASTRVCNVLALFQCIASHPETRSPFIEAHIPSYLYPFLHTVDKAQPFEHLRLATLGVIGALVKDENTKATVYLLKYDTIPLCLKIMEIGNEPSKTVSTFILLKVLLNEVGLHRCCDTRDPFYAIAFALQKMVSSPDDRPSARLLKCIIRCYHRLFDHPRGHAVLKTRLPSVLQTGTFNDYLMKDPSMQECLQQLLAKLEVGSPNQVAPFSPPQ